MTIAFYLESTNSPGGVNRVVSLIATELSVRGYDVHIISRYEGRTALFPLDGHVVLHELFPRFISKYLSIFSEYRKLRAIIRDHKIDVLVSAGATFFVLAHKIRGVRHFAWDHTSFWYGNKMLRYCRRRAVRYAEKIIVLTGENKREFESIAGAQAEIVTLYNPRTFVSDTTADMNSKIVLAVGNIGLPKGYDLLIDVWKRLSPDIRKTWSLWIVGKDEGLRSGLEADIRMRGINGIEFLGFRKDIHSLMSQASIYVMSSKWEGLPMSLIEAQSAGLPVISFDCKTGPADIVIPGTGILVPPGDTYRFAKELERMMRDEELRKICSNNAFRASARFDIGKIADAWEQILK